VRAGLRDWSRLPKLFRYLFVLPGGQEAKWWSVGLSYRRRLTARQVRLLPGEYGHPAYGHLADHHGIVWEQWPDKRLGEDSAAMLLEVVQRVDLPVRIYAIPTGHDCGSCPWSDDGEPCEVGRGCVRLSMLVDWHDYDPRRTRTCVPWR
jgi:hypothetical protein